MHRGVSLALTTKYTCIQMPQSAIRGFRFARTLIFYEYDP